MLTSDDIQQIAKLLDQKLESSEKRIGERINTVDAKIEMVLDQNKKEHMEIMESIVESNETTGQQLKEHDERLIVEEHTGIAKPHKN